MRNAERTGPRLAKNSLPWLKGCVALCLSVASAQIVTAQEILWPAADVTPPPGEIGAAIAYGRDLVVRTYSLIGPEVADPSMRFAGNNLACSNCHLEAGTKKYALPFVGVFGDFPLFRAREGRVGTLEERINGCLERSMNGRPMDVSSREMVAFVSYIKFLSKGRPIGASTEGRGTPEFAPPPASADPIQGAGIYVRICSNCHGEDGRGKRNGALGDRAGYVVPPLWGADSFNDGAGMDRVLTLAGFAHANMPNGVSWSSPLLSEKEALDVAAFIDSQPRPHMSGLDADYPDRRLKPFDAAYGPWSDELPPERHKYGPFPVPRKKESELTK